MAVCPSCGNQTGEGAVFCDRCGTRLPKADLPGAQAPQGAVGGSVICPACGAGNVPGEAFCDFCGSPLEAPVPAVPATPEPQPAAPAAPPEVAPAVAPEAAPAVAPAVVPALPQAGPALAPEEPPTCPACGAQVQAGEAFCPDCGASLAQPPLPPEPVPEAAAAPSVVPPVPIQVPPAPAPEAAPPPSPTCPACGALIEPGDKFCSNCGASQVLPLAPVPAPPAELAPAPPSIPALPRLVVVASGAEIPLPAKAELLIGREDPVSGIFPDVDLTPHGGEDAGVSRRHARILVEAGAYSIEDLNSTNFTLINKVKLTPKARAPLHDGDEIRCGRLALILKLGA